MQNNLEKKNHIRGDNRNGSPLDENISWASDLKRTRKDGPGLDYKLWSGQGHSTKAVHAGTTDDERTGAVGTPIYQNSTFLLEKDQYESIEQGHARERFIYTRYGNPNQWAVQQKLAALEKRCW